MKSAIVSPSLQDTCVHCSHGMQDNAEAILTDQLPKLERLWATIMHAVVQAKTMQKLY